MSRGTIHDDARSKADWFRLRQNKKGTFHEQSNAWDRHDFQALAR
jgi:hypothetical protein